MAFGAGLALAASFIDFRLFVLPWIALVPLIALAERSTPSRAFCLGYLAGAAGIALAFSWLVYTIRVFGGFSTAAAAAIYLAPVAWMATEFGLFTGLVAWLGPLPLGLAAPIVFTAVEFLFPSPFPWRLAHSQYRVPNLLQTGELAGPFLLTFTMVWTSSGLLRALRAAADRRTQREAPGGRVGWSIVAPAILFLGVATYGSWRLGSIRAARTQAPSLWVGVVQGNIGVARKSDRSLLDRNVERYRALSRLVAPEVDLLIWPETVVQRHLPIEREFLTAEESPFPDVPRPLVFGGLAVDTLGGKRRLFNSAFLLREDGRVAGRYDKRVLLPFGEYMPLGDRLPRLRELSPATSHFTAGARATVLTLNTTARLGPLICYEDVIPAPSLDAVAKGATLLLNLTNDAWYGDSAEPAQHQALALWRAVENRRDFIRSTDTGLTSVIAATGEVIEKLPTFEAATLVAEVRLLEGTTIYATVGELFAWSTVAALLASALWRTALAGGAAGSLARRRLRERNAARI